MVSRNEDGPLISLSLKEFVLSLGDRTSAPGGGSASAAVAAMVSSLDFLFLFFCRVSFDLTVFYLEKATGYVEPNARTRQHKAKCLQQVRHSFEANFSGLSQKTAKACDCFNGLLLSCLSIKQISVFALQPVHIKPNLNNVISYIKY